MRGATVLLMATIIIATIILETYAVVGSKPTGVLRRRQKVRHYIVRCCSSNKARSSCNNPPTKLRTSTTETTAAPTKPPMETDSLQQTTAAPTKPPVKTTVRSPSSSAHRQTVVSTPRPPTAGRVKSSREPLPTEVPAQEPGTSVLEEITNQEQPHNQLPSAATASDSASTDVTEPQSSVTTWRISLTGGQSQPPGSAPSAAQTGGVSLQTLPQASAPGLQQTGSGAVPTITNTFASGTGASDGINPTLISQQGNIGSNPAISTVKGAATSQSTAGVTTMSGGVTVNMVPTTSQSQGTVMGATNGPASTVVEQQTTVKVQATAGVAMSSSDAGPTVLAGLQSTASTLSEVQTRGVISSSSTASDTASTSLITNGGIPPTGGQTFSQTTGAGSTAPAAQTVAGSPQTVLQGSSDPGVQSTGGATTDPATDTGASSVTNPASIAHQESSPVVTVDNTPTSVRNSVTTVAGRTGSSFSSQPKETTITNGPVNTTTEQQTSNTADEPSITDAGDTMSSEVLDPILDQQSTEGGSVTLSDLQTNTNKAALTSGSDLTQTKRGSVTQMSGSVASIEEGTLTIDALAESAQTQSSNTGVTVTQVPSRAGTATETQNGTGTTQVQRVEGSTQTKQGSASETTQAQQSGVSQTTQAQATGETTTQAHLGTAQSTGAGAATQISTGVTTQAQSGVATTAPVTTTVSVPTTSQCGTICAASTAGDVPVQAGGLDATKNVSGNTQAPTGVTAPRSTSLSVPSPTTTTSTAPTTSITTPRSTSPTTAPPTTSTTAPRATSTTPPRTTTKTTPSCGLCQGCAADIQSRIAAIKDIPAQTKAPTALSLITLNNGTKYFFNKDKTLTWFAALTFCRTYGMDLLSIDTEDEQNAIAAMLKSNGRDGNYVYTGGNKIGRTCPYIWEATGQDVGYENWNAGEPSQWAGENCMIIWTNSRWYDLPCNWAVHFVCELN